MSTHPLADAMPVPTLQASDITWLRQEIRGDLILSDDPGYAQARRVWNGMVDKRPAAVIYCAGTDDVIAAVNFARSRNFLVSVRGGGHNVAGYSVCGVALPSSVAAGWARPPST